WLTLAWVRHVDRLDPVIVLLGADIAQGQGCLTQGSTFLLRFFGDGGGLVVADMPVKRSHQHQIFFKVISNTLAVRLDPDSTMIIKSQAGISQQGNTFQYVMHHDRLVYIQLEIALRASKSRGRIVTKYLHAYHGHS